MKDNFEILGNVVNLITFIQFIIEMIYWFGGKQSRSIALANRIQKKNLRQFTVATIKLIPAIISVVLLFVTMTFEGQISVLIFITIGFSVSIIISNILFYIISNEIDKLKQSVSNKITINQAMAIAAAI